MYSKMILSVAAAAVLFTSCRKDEGPDTRAIMGYQLLATDTAAGIQGKGTADAAIHWHAGFANPREMRFEGKQNGGEKTEFRTLNNRQVNLFGSPTLTPFGNFAVAQGNYTDVEMKLRLTQNILAPALELQGNFVSATVTSPMPVLLQINDVCEIKTEVKNLTVDTKANFQAITSLDLSYLTNGITEEMISNAEISGGKLIISDRANQNLYSIVMNNLNSKRHEVKVDRR